MKPAARTSRPCADRTPADLGPPEPLPRHVVPMTGLTAAMPRDQDDYGFEFKWDGVRAILYWDTRRLLVESRNLLDVTAQYPEITPLGRSLRRRSAVLDGEIVALDSDLRPSFELLQRRMHVSDAASVAKLVGEVPVAVLLFDILHLDGKSTRRLPYTRRREILEGLGLSGPNWQTPPWEAGHGSEMLRIAASVAWRA